MEADSRLAFLEGQGKDKLPSYQLDASIIVTGASGQIGLATVKKLLNTGAEVHALTRTTSLGFASETLQWHHADLETNDWDFNVSADTLIHTASLWLLPNHLTRFAECGVNRLIAFGSTSMFSKISSENPGEQIIVELLKQAEHDIARECDRLNIKWTILRPTMVYGLGLDKNITTIMQFIKRFGVFPVHGKADGARKPVHASDLAQAAIDIIEEPRTYNSTYNLGGGEQLSYREMVQRIFAYVGKKPRFVNVPHLPFWLDIYAKCFHSHLNGEMARRMNQDLVFDDSAAKKDFGYAPRKFLK